MRKWKKKTRIMRRMIMTMRYGLIRLQDIGTLHHKGCLDSAKLQGATPPKISHGCSDNNKR